MSRPVAIIVIALLAIVGVMVLLSMKSSERAPVRVEKAVPLANLQ